MNDGSIKMSGGGKIRQSNMELLRIVAMAMVLVVHADFWSLGKPTVEEYELNPWNFALRHAFESLSIVCVNVFVLISGYFSIHPTIKSFSNFVFQCLFFLFSIYIISICIGLSELSIHGLMECFCLRPINWFIKAYIVLYILSPVLNAFVDSTNKKQLLNVLIAFYIFQSIWGQTGATSFFNRGHSPLSFIGLYLLGRFIKMYLSSICEKSKYYYLTIYICLSAFLLLLQFAPILIGREIYLISKYDYVNPIIIFSSVALLIYFSKHSFQSKTVNWIAASSFAVFLLHSNPNINESVFKEICINIYHNYNGLACVGIMGLFLLIVYIVAILYDQLRLFLWRLLSKNI